MIGNERATLSVTPHTLLLKLSSKESYNVKVKRDSQLHIYKNKSITFDVLIEVSVYFLSHKPKFREFVNVKQIYVSVFTNSYFPISLYLKKAFDFFVKFNSGLGGFDVSGWKSTLAGLYQKLATKMA